MRIIGIMRVSVCLGAILIPEYVNFHSGYSAPRSRIAGIYSGIYSGINSYKFLFRNIPNERALRKTAIAGYLHKHRSSGFTFVKL